MTPAWRNTIDSWAQPPSETERQKAQRAEAAVRTAVDASTALNNHRVFVVPQGSYRNRTNVRSDSDVDLCVLGDEMTFFELPTGKVPQDFGITVPGPYDYSTFKNDVEDALTAHFGSGQVHRGTKAFDIHHNTYRIDADVIPCFEYQDYPEDGDVRIGTSFVPDGRSDFVFNFPQQNYDNGVLKNQRTGRRFKAVVRVLKSLCYSMQGAGVPSASNIPSYLIECLAWNALDEYFVREPFADAVGAVIADIWTRTGTKYVYNDWLEVNGIKYLFHGSEPWTLSQANAFMYAAWNHVGFS